MRNLSNYNDFQNQIKEGLIRTYPLKSTIKSLSRELSLKSVKHGIDSEESTNTIFIKAISEDLSSDNIISILRSVNLCGYFISNYDFYDENDVNVGYLIHNFSVDLNFMNELLTKINNSHYTQITIESKYNDKVNLPPYLFHVTSEKNKDKIEKFGLIPKSKNKRANHNDRIYLGYNPIVVKNLAYQFSTGEYILLKISTKELKINLYDDPDFTKNGSYTYDNIPPSNIQIIDKFIVE